MHYRTPLVSTKHQRCYDILARLRLRPAGYRVSKAAWERHWLSEAASLEPLKSKADLITDARKRKNLTQLQRVFAFQGVWWMASSTQFLMVPFLEGPSLVPSDLLMRSSTKTSGKRPLPYNDVLDSSHTKPEAATVVPWFRRDFVHPGQSVLRGRWIEIRDDGRGAYAQWLDVGPHHTDDAAYVFGSARPSLH
jgi:hypothetical protein